MITFHDVSIELGQKRILKDVSFKMKRGEFVCLLGPNGSGKTTLLKLINGILKPQTGRVLIDDMFVNNLSSKGLALKCATVFQESSFSFPFKVLDVVLMSRFAHSGAFHFDQVHDLTLALKNLKRTDALNLKDQSILSLSGGEKQRVMIARALTQETPLLLLDEPTSHMDLKYAVAFFKLFKKLRDQESKTLFCVVHDINLALKFADRLLFLKEGRIKGDVTPDQVTESLLEDVYDSSFRKTDLSSFVPQY